MIVSIDKSSGFCFGVTGAIKKAEEELAKGEKLYCLGDIVGKGPSSAETFDWAYRRCQVIVQGNWDYGIGEKLFPNDQFYYDQLGEERMRKLRELPREFSFTMSGRKIRLIHGRPVMQSLLTPSASAESFRSS